MQGTAFSEPQGIVPGPWRTVPITFNHPAPLRTNLEQGPQRDALARSPKLWNQLPQSCRPRFSVQKPTESPSGKVAASRDHQVQTLMPPFLECVTLSKALNLSPNPCLSVNWR